MPVSQNGVTKIILIGPPYIFAAAHTHRMLRTCAALGMKNIVVIALPVQMRALRPMHTPQGAVPHIFTLSHQLPGIQIQLLYPDIPVTVIPAALRIGMCAYIITFSVIVKKQTGVNAIRPLQIMRLRPGALGLLGCNHIVAAMGHIGTYHIKCPLIPADRGGKQSLGVSRALQRQLGSPIHHIANLLPVYQISAVQHRQTRKIGKS